MWMCHKVNMDIQFFRKFLKDHVSSCIVENKRCDSRIHPVDYCIVIFVIRDHDIKEVHIKMTNAFFVFCGQSVD